MTKKSIAIIAFLLILILCIVPLVGAVILKLQSIVNGSGVVKNEQRDLIGYKNIIVNGDFVVTLKESVNEGVEISAEDNFLPKIITEVSGDNLNIYVGKVFSLFSSYDLHKTSPINIKIKYKNINLVKLNGSGSINNEDDKLRSDNLKVELNGSGEIKQNIFANNLNLSLNGSGKINLSGAVKIQNINVSGSGELNLKDLECKETTIQLNGSSQAMIRADEKLQININGSGLISYYGSPKSFNQNINGSGQVKQLQ